MNAEKLQDLLQTDRPRPLLHVLPPEVFAASRIPGSINACIYETAFLDKVKELQLDPTAPIIVYGAGEGSLDTVTAVEKLREAGFTQVQPFEGGLAAWIAAGLPLEGTGQLPAPPVLEGIYTVDTTESIIRWTGRNLFNHHNGTVRLAGGEPSRREASEIDRLQAGPSGRGLREQRNQICMHEGQLASARFTIDMTSIANEDIADPGMNAMLLAHLRTTDFFDTDRHPTAEFVADTAEPIESCTEGTPSHRMRGIFTLRGISQPLDFPVLIAAKDAGHLTGQGVLDLDRTSHGSLYGSGKLFRYLGPHIVNDHIHLHVKIHATREG